MERTSYTCYAQGYLNVCVDEKEIVRFPPLAMLSSRIPLVIPYTPRPLIPPILTLGYVFVTTILIDSPPIQAEP